MTTAIGLHPVILVRPQRTKADCAIACLAMLLHVDYEDVLTTAARTFTRPHRNGLYLIDMERIAKMYGHRLRRTRTYDLDADTGILGIRRQDDAHVVVLREGVLIDPVDGEVWFDPSAYIESMGVQHGPLLKYEGGA